MDEDELFEELVGDVDMIGGDDFEIVGDDDDFDDDEDIEGDMEIVGARGSKRRRRLRRLAARRRKMLRSPKNYMWRRQTLGLTSDGDVTAGTTATITARPQRDFKGKRLVITSDVAYFFDLTDIKVGQASQNVASGVLPGGMFVEDAVSVFVDWDTANVGNEITLFADNIDAADHPFRAGVVGLVAIAQY